MDRMLKFLDELGAAAGIGIVLLVTSWGLLVADLLEFKLAGLATLPTVKLIACIAGTLGLLLVLYRLKDVRKKEISSDAVSKEDSNRWERFISFVKDRRALAALQDYEHLPSMLKSIDAVRDYLRKELDTLPAATRIRGDFETLQEACRDFETIYEQMWRDRESAPSHLINALPIDQWRVCTAIGVLRGQIAAVIKGRGIAGSAAMTARLVGRVD